MRKQVQYRLLVVRLGAMGDILHALPAITALRQAHPAWIIDWAIDPRWRSLLTAEPETPSLAQPIDNPPNQYPQIRSQTQPLVDRLHLVPTKAWSRHPFSAETRASIRTLRADLNAGSYDAVLDVQGSIRSAIIARFSGCHRLLGESKPRENLARWLYTERIETTGLHVIEQDIELASAIAGDLLTPTPAALPYDPESEYWCDQQEEVRRAEWAGKPLILIHPGAGWGAKRWPPDRYGIVAIELVRRGAVVLVNVGPDEEALGQAVVQASDGVASVIESTLPQLIALTRRTTIAIGGDTGPLHLANALGRPVVGIYGPTDPQRNGPFSKPFRVLRNPESRRDHTRREETEAGLLTILPEDVLAATFELLLESQQGAQDRPDFEASPAHPAFEQDNQGQLIHPQLTLEAGPILEGEIPNPQPKSKRNRNRGRAHA